MKISVGSSCKSASVSTASPLYTFTNGVSPIRDRLTAIYCDLSVV